MPRRAALKGTYDVIVVGAGSAGAVLAARLSEDPDRSVLLLEAGGSHKTVLIDKPGMVAVIHTQPDVKKRFDWGFKTAPQAHANDRVIPYTRGKVLGGSSSINGMVFVRGHRGVFDGWKAEGCEGWGYDDVLPSFRKLEDWEGDSSSVRGKGGPIAVSRPPPDDMSPVSHAFLEAASDTLGVPVLDDYNGAEMEGVARFQFSYRDGKRFSTARGYLDPAATRPNLTVASGAHVHRLLFQGTRCVGVRLALDGQIVDAYAEQEVVLSGGAVGSPHLLLLSGVGPADDLRRLKLPVVADLPVGRNLHDHLFFPLTFHAPNGGHFGTPAHFFAGMAREFLRGGTWFGRSVFETCGFLKSDPSLTVPDLQLHALPWAYPAYQDTDEQVMDVDKRGALSLFATMVAPKSRGELRLRSTSPDDMPHIDPAFLADPDDAATLERCIALCREVAAHPALGKELDGEIQPGTAFLADRLRAEIRQRAFTVYHPVGTCKMGVGPDAVVDPNLRVHGIEGLRVADASIMPTITNGNTNAPSIMIGERAAALIRG